MDKMTDSRAADAQAQGGGEACPHCKGNPGLDCNRFGRTAPPSAPVGVEGLVVKWRKESESLDIHPAGLAARRICAVELEHALKAQQPAAVDEDAAITRMCEAHYGVQFGYSKAARDKMRRLLTAALAQQPAAVDGAMVERCTDVAIASSTQRYRGESARDSWRRLVRDVLTAALAAQPGGSDNDR